MELEKLGKYIEETSIRNKQNFKYSVYSVTNRSGFCKEFFDKDVSSSNKTNYKIVPRNYFAYNPSRINVGSIDIQTKEEFVLVSPLYITFKCNNKLNPILLLKFLKSPIGKDLIKQNTTGSVRNNLKFKALANIDFPFCPLIAQEKIVKELDFLERTINICDMKLMYLDELIESIFFEMFGNPLNEEYKYQKVRLADITTYESSNMQINKLESNFGEYPLYGASGLIKKIDFFTSDKPYVGIVKDGAGVGNILECVPYSSVVATLGKIYPKNNCTLEYLKSLLKLLNLGENFTGSTIPHIYYKDYSKINVCLPPLQLQIEFDKYVRKINESKKIIKQLAKNLQELLDKKMDEYFNVE